MFCFLVPFLSICEKGTELTCSRGYLCVSSTLTMMSPQSPSSTRSYLFRAVCFHAVLIDPRWALTELHAISLKLGFYWHWSAAVSREPRLSVNTLPAPDGYVATPSFLYALNTCASLRAPSLTHTRPLCCFFLFWCKTFSVTSFFSLQPVVWIDVWAAEDLKLIDFFKVWKESDWRRGHDPCGLPLILSGVILNTHTNGVIEAKHPQSGWPWLSVFWNKLYL